MKPHQCRKEAPNDVDKDLLQELLVDHVEVKIYKEDAVVDGTCRGDVLDDGTWC